MTKRTEAEWLEFWRKLLGTNIPTPMTLRIFAEAVRREALQDLSSHIHELFDGFEGMSLRQLMTHRELTEQNGAKSVLNRIDDYVLDEAKT